MAVLAFSYFFFHTAESYNKGTSRRYQACHEGAAQSKQACVSISAENRPACIVAAALEENRCLDSATDSGPKRAEVLGILALRALCWSALFSGQHDQSGGYLRQRWSDFKAHRRQRFFSLRASRGPHFRYRKWCNFPIGDSGRVVAKRYLTWKVSCSPFRT
jgi:hypothetical protein